MKRFHQNNYKIPDCTNNKKVVGLYQKYCSLWQALAACALAAVFPNHSSLFIDAAIYSSPTSLF